MRVNKFLSVIVPLTLVCLLQVHLQTEIFHLAYAASKKNALLEDLWNKNSFLKYYKEKKASLVKIGSVLEDKNFQMPGEYRLVRLRQTEKLNIASGHKRKNIVWRIFSVSKQAQAQTISP